MVSCEFQEQSSVATFRACSSAIGVFQPDWFLLENVDMEADDAESNLALIVKYLTEIGYEVQVFRTCAADFGLPQRRIRLYIGGFHRLKQPECSFRRVERMLNVMRLPSQYPDSCQCSFIDFFFFDSDSRF